MAWISSHVELPRCTSFPFSLTNDRMTLFFFYFSHFLTKTNLYSSLKANPIPKFLLKEILPYHHSCLLHLILLYQTVSRFSVLPMSVIMNCIHDNQSSKITHSDTGKHSDHKGRPLAAWVRFKHNLFYIFYTRLGAVKSHLPFKLSIKAPLTILV